MTGWQGWPLAATLLVATVLAGIGGELFVRGVVGTATRWRVPSLLVAMTVAACATSAPELTVTIMASAAGHSALALGDALGSNVTNILLILGVALLFGPMSASARTLRWHFVCVVCAPLATMPMLSDGTVSRLEGALLMAFFLAWLAATVVHLRRERTPRTDAGVQAGVISSAQLLILLAGGVAMLGVAGRLFANGGSQLAVAFGVPDAVVGATVVALGTSMPELMTTLVSRLRGHTGVGLGTLLGSNLVNGLAILGTAAMIAPVRAPLVPVSVTLGFGIAAVASAMPRADCLDRRRGVLMLVLYGLYVLLLSFAPHDVPG